MPSPSFKSVSSGGYLDGRNPGMSEPLLSSGSRNPATDAYLQWIIGDAGNGRKFIKSVSSGGYLDGRNPGMSEPLLSSGSRNPATDAYLQWIIGDAGNGRKFIKSVSSGGYLDGRNPGMSEPLLSPGSRNPATDAYLQWYIENMTHREVPTHQMATTDIKDHSRLAHSSKLNNNNMSFQQVSMIKAGGVIKAEIVVMATSDNDMNSFMEAVRLMLTQPRTLNEPERRLASEKCTSRSDFDWNFIFGLLVGFTLACYQIDAMVITKGEIPCYVSLFIVVYMFHVEGKIMTRRWIPLLMIALSLISRFDLLPRIFNWSSDNATVRENLMISKYLVTRGVADSEITRTVLVDSGAGASIIQLIPISDSDPWKILNREEQMNMLMDRLKELCNEGSSMGLVACRSMTPSKSETADSATLMSTSDQVLVTMVKPMEICQNKSPRCLKEVKLILPNAEEAEDLTAYSRKWPQVDSKISHTPPAIGAVAGTILTCVALIFWSGQRICQKIDEGNKTKKLHKAASKGDIGTVTKLVNDGADIKAMLDGGITALMLAANRGHMDLVHYLIKQGANKETKDKYGWTALIMAASGGNLNVVRILVAQGAKSDSKDDDGCTALIWSARCGHEYIVRYLVEKDADKEVKNNDGCTALIYAVREGHTEVVQYLVEKGADASCLDNEGNSVLVHLLQRSESDENVILPIAKLLLEHRAPPLETNKQGKSAKSIARDKEFHNVIDLIEEYEAKSRSPARFASNRVVDVTDWFIKPEKVRYAEKPFTIGGFGKVYRAVWEHNDVVLKEITINTAVEKETFLREVNNWRKARHPNIVPFYGANHLETPCFMISQFATKGTLKDYLYTEKKSNQSTVWRKLLDVAKGLSYLHGQNIVHGDLKGDNIVVGEDRTAMLTDFGLSFVDTRSTRPQQDNLGAMRWRAPEYATQTVHKPSFESDVYSLGMCIVEAVTGDYPWGSLEDAVVTYNLRDGIPLQKPREMNGEQWKLVQGMTVFERTARTSLAKVIEQLVVFAELEEAIELSTRPTDEDQTRQNQQDHSSTSSEYFQSGSSDSARCSDGKIKWSRSL